MLAAQQQQQQAALAAGKPGMPGKHESQQQAMQRMYGAERSVISPPGLLSGRHAAAAAPAGSKASAVAFSMGMNIRPMSGEPAGHPLSPDSMCDTAGVRDTGAAAAAAYAAAEVQAHMQQQALAQQEQQVRQVETIACCILLHQSVLTLPHYLLTLPKCPYLCSCSARIEQVG
jgi:hypothetical protein